MTKEIMRCFIGLGSNIGDRRSFLENAVAMITDIVNVSSLYETAPIGGPEQEPFLNMVVELQTLLGPYEVLELCRKLEANAYRERTIRWGPRTLDADVLIYGNLVLDDVELTLPHPRMWNRAFVMYPLAELAPELLPEDWEVSVIGQEVKLIQS